MATNVYYQENFAGVAGQTARADSVKSEFDSVQSAFDSIEVDVNRGIKAPGTETPSDLPAAASRANKYLRFDASGNPVVIDGPWQFIGNWAASTAYAVGDIVAYNPNGSLYLCITAHTSTSSFDSSKFVVLVDLNGLFFAEYQVINGPATVSAAKGASYFCDSSTGDITINLPTDAALGDSPINVTHVGGSLSTGQKLTISSGSLKIMGTVETSLSVDVANASMTLAYGGSSYGWRLRTMG